MLYYERKMIIKFLLASLITLTNSEDCSKSCIRISVLAFLCWHWSIFCIYVQVGFWNKFENHRWLSKQLYSQAATWKPEQASWRRLLERFSEFVKDKQAETSFLTFSAKRQPNHVKNHMRWYTKSTFWFLELSVKYSSRDTVAFKHCTFRRKYKQRFKLGFLECRKIFTK